jgi:hypothetical protein
MSQAKLSPGDHFYIEQNGRKLRGIVADFLPMKHGRKTMIPFVRPRNTKRVVADSPNHKPIKCRWLERKLVRKLPKP